MLARRLSTLANGNVTAPCTPPDSFTRISFDHAHLVRSNLGGQGGRCVDRTFGDGLFIPWSDSCDEQQSASTPHEIYIRNVGTTASGTSINMHIRNETEYRAWRTGPNGIKRVAAASGPNGFFGVVNLLGPRSPTQQPAAMVWNSHLTVVQLRYTFVDAANDALLTIGRMHLTFFDFDTGMSQVSAAVPAVEIMQVGPQASTVSIPAVTDMLERSESAFEQSLSPEALFFIQNMPEPWSTHTYAATIYGVGNDNPADPYALTELQQRRSVMVTFESLSSFQVRYAIHGCCTTGAQPPTAHT
jgi:hypothetical protein